MKSNYIFLIIKTPDFWFRFKTGIIWTRSHSCLGLLVWNKGSLIPLTDKLSKLDMAYLTGFRYSDNSQFIAYLFLGVQMYTRIACFYG